MDISGYGTHFGGMIISSLIIFMSFSIIFYIVVAQASSMRAMRKAYSNDSPDEKGDE